MSFLFLKDLLKKVIVLDVSLHKGGNTDIMAEALKKGIKIMASKKGEEAIIKGE